MRALAAPRPAADAAQCGNPAESGTTIAAIHLNKGGLKMWCLWIIVAFVANGLAQFGLHIAEEMNLVETHAFLYLAFWFFSGFVAGIAISWLTPQRPPIRRMRSSWAPLLPPATSHVGSSCLPRSPSGFRPTWRCRFRCAGASPLSPWSACFF